MSKVEDEFLLSFAHFPILVEDRHRRYAYCMQMHNAQASQLHNLGSDQSRGMFVVYRRVG
jgi:hypothetical protein